jgi:hypothetical protein
MKVGTSLPYASDMDCRDMDWLPYDVRDAARSADQHAEEP